MLVLSGFLGERGMEERESWEGERGGSRLSVLSGERGEGKERNLIVRFSFFSFFDESNLPSPANQHQ